MITNAQHPKGKTVVNLMGGNDDLEDLWSHKKQSAAKSHVINAKLQEVNELMMPADPEIKIIDTPIQLVDTSNITSNTSKLAVVVAHAKSPGETHS